MTLFPTENILSQGEHMGFPFMVVHNSLGYRCGYICIPKGHPWFSKDYDDIDAFVHGGLTFARYDDEDSYWIGFDCAHYNDAPDPLLPATYRLHSDGVVRTQEYVEAGCRSLCEQAATASEQIGE
jgi:hypothetical protein